MSNLENTTVSIANTLRAISDDKSLILFNTIALTTSDTPVLISKLGLTRKQYYSRMSGLINAGLVMRKNGDYFLTSFGKVVYEAQILIKKTKQYFWKLKAIDSSSHGLTIEERSKIIDVLIADKELKEILLSPNKNETVEKNINQQLISPQQCPDQKPLTQQPSAF